MNIKTTELPMTVDAVRQEVIKKQREKVISAYEQKYMNTAFLLLIAAFVGLLIQHPHHMNKVILIIQLGLILTSVFIFAYTFQGLVRKHYIQKLFPTNFGLSEDDISKKMIEYMEGILDTMNKEMSDLDKKKEQIIKEDKETSEAYYKVYLDYNNLIAKINPQHFSCMEGGDRY